MHTANVGTGAALAVALTVGGCYGGLDASTGEQDGDLSAGGDADGDGPGDDADDGEADDGAGDGGDDGPPDAACEGADTPPVALRFLTRLEYANTIEALLGDARGVTDSFVPDEQVGGFFANSVQPPSATQLERFVDAAKTLGAAAVTEELDRFVTCDPDAPGCTEAFIAEFGRRAFRRPLSPQEIDDYLGDAEAIAAEQGAAIGMEVAASAMLASPNFLYVGMRTEGDAALHAYDLASRLSYFLWASMPDNDLLDAAEAGTLDTHDGVRAQVERMLADPRAAAMLRSFTTQWLEVDALAAGTTKNADLFPEWTDALADAAETEIAALMERVVLDGDGTFATLMSSREAWIDASLAEVYGVAAPEGGPGWVTLPDAERAGPLTRVAYLAGHAHADANSWVHRGKVIRERVLCEPLPPPPPVADDSPINDDSRLTDNGCKSCHLLMDPIGYGLDGYDPLGRFEATDTPGWVEGLEPSEFAGGVELAQRLAAEPRVASCFAQQMYRFAHRRALSPADACAVESINTQFADSDGDIVLLIVGLATSNVFAGWEEA